MKPLSLSLVLGLALLFALPSGAWAYSGIDGRVVDSTGAPWTYGGEVYVGWTTRTYVDNVDLYRTEVWATAKLDASGSFGANWCDDQVGGVIPLPCSPNQWSDAYSRYMTIILVLHADSQGDPRVQEFAFREYRFIKGRYHLGSVAARGTASGVSQETSLLPLVENGGGPH